jgi:hypothetical protein
MNRINPLYLGGFLIVLLLFFSFKLNLAKSQLAEAKESYKESLKLSTDLSELKKVYKKEPRLRAFKSASIVQTKTKSGVILDAKSIDIKELNSLMAKLLNGAYNITALKIKKVSDTKASLHLEIKW